MQEYFKHLNNYFDKIYVLSVPLAEERRKKFTQQFEGLDYSFFLGADKNQFTIEEATAKGIYSEALTRHHHRYNKAMMHGEIACSWSHRMIYEEMLDCNYQRIFIFEDDATPDHETIKNIPFIVREIPPNCELLMWGWSKNGEITTGKRFKQLFYHLQHKLGLLKWDHNIIRNLYAVPHSVYLKKKGFHDYTYAYSLTRACAQKLVKMQTPIQYIADNLLAHAATTGMINGYITYPSVFLHDMLHDGTVVDSYIR